YYNQNSNYDREQNVNPDGYYNQNPNYDREQNVNPDGYYNQNSNYDREQNVNPDQGKNSRDNARMAGLGAGLVGGAAAAGAAAGKAVRSGEKQFSKQGSMEKPSISDFRGKPVNQSSVPGEGIEGHRAGGRVGAGSQVGRNAGNFAGRAGRNAGNFAGQDGRTAAPASGRTAAPAAGRTAASAAGKTAAAVTAHTIPVKAVAVAVAVAAAGTAGGIAYKSSSDRDESSPEAVETVVSASSETEDLFVNSGSQTLSGTSSESIETEAVSSASAAETEQEPEPWMIAYQQFLDNWRLDEQYYDNSYLGMFFSNEYDFDQYCLIDVDGNGIPEFFLYSTLTDLTHIYTCDENGTVSTFHYEGQIEGINKERHAVVTHGHWHGAGGSGIYEYTVDVLDGQNDTRYYFDGHEDMGYHSTKYEYYEGYGENGFTIEEELPGDQATYDQLYNQYVAGAKPYEEYPKLPLTTPIYTGDTGGGADAGTDADSEAAWITGCYTSQSIQPPLGIRIFQDGGNYKVDFFANLNLVICDAIMNDGVLTVQGSQGPFTLRRDESSGMLIVDGDASLVFDSIVAGEATSTEYSFQDTYTRSYDAYPDKNVITRGARESLGVPADANVTAEIGEPYFYYQYGDNGFWGVSVSFLENNNYVAAGAADMDTGNVDHNIYGYNPNGIG
ncbi:MAG: hypothetical protein U0L49_11060, partial [Eubacterium sp.]|nr:hypothetical protein [Eubacterium sp.]